MIVVAKRMVQMIRLYICETLYKEIVIKPFEILLVQYAGGNEDVIAFSNTSLDDGMIYKCSYDRDETIELEVYSLWERKQMKIGK